MKISTVNGMRRIAISPSFLASIFQDRGEETFFIYWSIKTSHAKEGEDFKAIIEDTREELGLEYLGIREKNNRYFFEFEVLNERKLMLAVLKYQFKYLI